MSREDNKSDIITNIFIDSGAQATIFSDEDYLYDIVETNEICHATNATEILINAKGKFDLILGTNKITIDVLISKDIEDNILAENDLFNKNIWYSSKPCLIYKNKNYNLIREEGYSYLTSKMIKTKTIHNIHRKLLHTNNKYLKQMIKAKDIRTKEKIQNEQECATCLQSKTTAASAIEGSRDKHNAKIPFVTIHSDVVEIKVKNKFKQLVVTFIDNYSRYAWLYPIKNKTGANVTDAFEQFHQKIMNQYDCHIKALHTDNGTEYTNNIFQEYLNKHNIIHTTSTAFTPTQNGIAERYNGKIIKLLRSMYIDSGLSPVRTLTLALNYINIIYNITYNRKISASPLRTLKNYFTKNNLYKLYSKEFDLYLNMNIDKLPIFGQEVAILDRTNTLKTNAKTITGTFVGIRHNQKLFLVDNKLIESNNYRFFQSGASISKDKTADITINTADGPDDDDLFDELIENGEWGMSLDSNQNDNITDQPVNNEIYQTPESTAEDNIADDEEIEIDLNSKDIPALMVKDSDEDLENIQDREYELENQINNSMSHGDNPDQLEENHDNLATTTLDASEFETANESTNVDFAATDTDESDSEYQPSESDEDDYDSTDENENEVPQQNNLIETEEQPPEDKNETLETDGIDPDRRKSDKSPNDTEQELEPDQEVEKSLTSPHLQMSLRNNNGNEDNKAQQEKKHDPTDELHKTTTESTQDKNVDTPAIIIPPTPSRKRKRLEDIGDMMYGIKNKRKIIKIHNLKKFLNTDEREQWIDRKSVV